MDPICQEHPHSWDCTEITVAEAVRIQPGLRKVQEATEQLHGSALCAFWRAIPTGAMGQEHTAGFTFLFLFFLLGTGLQNLAQRPGPFSRWGAAASSGRSCSPRTPQHSPSLAPLNFSKLHFSHKRSTFRPILYLQGFCFPWRLCRRINAVPAAHFSQNRTFMPEYNFYNLPEQ